MRLVVLVELVFCLIVFEILCGRKYGHIKYI